MTSLTISDEEDDHDNDDFFDVQVSTFKLWQYVTSWAGLFFTCKAAACTKRERTTPLPSPLPPNAYPVTSLPFCCSYQTFSAGLVDFSLVRLPTPPSTLWIWFCSIRCRSASGARAVGHHSQRQAGGGGRGQHVVGEAQGGLWRVKGEGVLILVGAHDGSVRFWTVNLLWWWLK